MSDPLAAHALIVVDVQKGFDDEAHWGKRDNPRCEENVRALIRAWRARGRPVVFVRHDSTEAQSPLSRDGPGNAFKDVVEGTPDLLVSKSTNSCFYGRPDLHQWLQARDVRGVVICGITTNHCCETTARMAGNLGYDVRFALDATHTFDRRGPDGTLYPAEQIARMTAVNLDGEFARVVSTSELI
jgi:nicotinamidase-related amidase